MFEWDAAKSEQNLLARSLPFELARAMFRGYVLERVDARRDYGEVCVRATGAAQGLILVCVYTDRRGVRRIISLRRANRRERDEYHQEVGRRDRP